MSGIVGTSHSKSGLVGISNDTAKAWASIDQIDSHDLRASFNCSGISDLGVGESRITFINQIPVTTGYAVVGSDIGVSVAGRYSTLTGNVAANENTNVEFFARHLDNATNYDTNSGSIIIFGN